MHPCVHTYSCVHVYMHAYTTISQTVNNIVSIIHRGNRAGDLYSCVSRWFTFQQGFRAHLPYTSPIKPLSLALTQLILTRAVPVISSTLPLSWVCCNLRALTPSQRLPRRLYALAARSHLPTRWACRQWPHKVCSYVYAV